MSWCDRIPPKPTNYLPLIILPPLTKFFLSPLTPTKDHHSADIPLHSPTSPLKNTISTQEHQPRTPKPVALGKSSQKWPYLSRLWSELSKWVVPRLVLKPSTHLYPCMPQNSLLQTRNPAYKNSAFLVYFGVCKQKEFGKPCVFYFSHYHSFLGT